MRATSAEADGVAAGAVWVNNEVILRFRSQDARAAGERAETVARRLRELALRSLRPDQLSVAQANGVWALLWGGELVATVDDTTAKASQSAARDLCEHWKERLAAALQAPYLIVEPRDGLLIPVGESRTVRFGTTVATPPVAESVAREAVRATADAARGQLTVEALAPATTTVILRVGPLEHAIAVTARKWAARIAAAATARVFGEAWGTTMGRQAAVNATLMGALPEPGAALRIAAVDEIEGRYRVEVGAQGPDYLPVARSVEVGLTQAPVGMPVAQVLFVSNFPERVFGPQTLLRQRLPGGQAARLMWHHASAGDQPLTIAARLVNVGGNLARARVTWADSGPGADEIFVGYSAMLRFWELLDRNCGFEAQIPACSVYEPSRIRAVTGRVVSGLMHVCAEPGSDLLIEVCARASGAEDDYFIPAPQRTWSDADLTRYDFIAQREVALEYVVGQRWTHAYLGQETITNDSGNALRGAYGVMHVVRMRAHNPTHTDARVQVVVRAGGGAGRAVASIDGKIAATHLLTAGEEEVLAERAVRAGQSEVMRMLIMPTAGSNLPVTLILRAR